MWEGGPAAGHLQPSLSWGGGGGGEVRAGLGEDPWRQRPHFLFLAGRGSLPPRRAQLSAAVLEDAVSLGQRGCGRACAFGHSPGSAVVLRHR